MPKRVEIKKDKFIAVKVEQTFLERLDRAVDSTDLCRSFIVRKAIEEYLERNGVQ